MAAFLRAAVTQRAFSPGNSVLPLSGVEIKVKEIGGKGRGALGWRDVGDIGAWFMGCSSVPLLLRPWGEGFGWVFGKLGIFVIYFLRIKTRVSTWPLLERMIGCSVGAEGRAFSRIGG